MDAVLCWNSTPKFLSGGCVIFFEIVGTERHCGNEHAVVKNCVRKLNLCEMWELLVPSVL